MTGEAAHICAASPGGPRYSAEQSPEDRCSIEKAIWVCSACADLIDKNQGADYAADILLDWKRQAESEALTAQAEPIRSLEGTWDSGMGGISYINVPRLAMWAAGRGIELDIGELRAASSLHALGWELNRVLIKVERLLKHFVAPAIRIESISKLTGDFTGITVSFERQFFTKNCPDLPLSGWAMPADWRHAPHIHCKIGKWRVVIVYDPKWVTTNTAFVEFRGGNRRFKGVGTVKEVDERLGLVLVSPIVIGFPKPLFDLYGDS